MKRTLIIDATWLIRRQFHAINKGFIKVKDKVTGEVILDESGEPVLEQSSSAVVISFLTCVMKKIREDFNYNCDVILAWDYGTWRYRPKEKHTEYKSDREYDNTFECCWKATDEAIEISREFGMKSVHVPGLEADDIGMYYSHNSSNPVLWAIDSDWQQSISKEGLIHGKKNKVWTYYDILEERSVDDPLDIAWSKAIDSGGHDNIQVVGYKPCGVKESIIAAKNRDTSIYSAEELDKIWYNHQLTRLDRVLTDEPVIDLILKSAAMTKIPNQISMLTAFSRLDNVPGHLTGSVGKFIRENF